MHIFFHETLFQFHYDLILLECYNRIKGRGYIFQFHYDLILLSTTRNSTINKIVLFQFHYDLILLRNY